MSWDEHVMLIAHTVNSFGDRLQVIGNTGSNSTREALHATEQGFAVGMHAALQINPYYGKTSLDGVMAHFTAVMHEGPTIIYNVPSRTGTSRTLLCCCANGRCAAHENSGCTATNIYTGLCHVFLSSCFALMCAVHQATQLHLMLQAYIRKGIV